jgi:hypothetical protein
MMLSQNRNLSESFLEQDNLQFALFVAASIYSWAVMHINYKNYYLQKFIEEESMRQSDE